MPETPEASKNNSTENFKDAAKRVKESEFPISSSQQKLRLYGLFMQSTRGPCTKKITDFSDPIGRAKYNAWVACKNMTQEEARREYVKLVKTIELHENFDSMAYSELSSPIQSDPDNSLTLLKVFRKNKKNYHHHNNNNNNNIGNNNKKNNNKLSPEEYEELSSALRLTSMFSHLKEEDMKTLANSMEKVPFKIGDTLGAQEGEPTKALYVITHGNMIRTKLGNNVSETLNIIPRPLKNTTNDNENKNNTPTTKLLLGDEETLISFGTLHALTKCPSYATTCALTDGVAWKLTSEQLIDFFNNPRFARGIATGLAAEIRIMSNSYRTPLLEQPPQVVNVAAVSVAAAFEAYYRSMMNALLNANLMKQSANVEFFPAMHMQIPARVLYINGFKAARQWLSDNVTIDDNSSWLSRKSQFLTIACMPGILMTPLSGVLEAFNAGKSNPEPLFRRSCRGFAPRCVREVIFGVGLNQLSDFCGERVSDEIATSKVLRTALGSVAAGIVAGYFSHVPHNLSTMKLHAPQISYIDHFKTLVETSRKVLPIGLPQQILYPAAVMRTLLLPQAIGLRTTQIIGSFVILNGISHILDIREWNKNR